MNFRDTVTELLKERGIKPAALAKQCGLTPQYMYDLLRGRRRWNEKTMNKVCQALNLQLEIKPADDTIPRAAGE